MKKILLTLFVSVLFVNLSKGQGCVPNCTLYTVTSIAPNIIPSAGTAVTLGDDQVSGACPIGFTFTFFCNAYTNFYISSNGFISFNPGVSQGCCSGAVIPSPGNAVNNMIAFDWNDLWPPGGGSIRYQTIGVAPNRICVITYSTINHCCSVGPTNTGQIKLFETTNAIEIHSGVVTTDGSTATQGIMNQAGTIAYPVTGRNGQTWTSTSSAFSFQNSGGGGPIAPPAILGNASICPGVPTVYSVTPIGGATSYNWTLPGGWTGSSSTNTILATPGATGVLSVTATFTCGTSAPATTLNVVVNPTPTVTITGGPLSVCPGNSVSLTGNGAQTYSWSTGVGGTNVVLNPTLTGVITVTGTSVAGCTATASQGYTVNPSPTVVISGTNQICQGQTVFLTASGATSYTWNTGAISPNISPSPTVNTTYSVIGTTGTCPGTAAINITVNPNPTVTIAGNNTLCAGSALNLTASGANSYTWSTGALTPTMTSNPMSNISYTVFGSNTLTGCSSSAVHNVTVNAIPTVTVTGPNAMCITQTINLNAFGANSYSWSTGALTQVIAVSPTVNTSYTVTGTSTLGCAGTPFVKNIIVNPTPTVGIASTSSLICKGETATITASGVNTYSWNTGALTPTISVSPSVTTGYTVMGTNTTTGCYNTVTINVVVSLCTGVEEVKESINEIKVYPNPNNGEFTVEYINGFNKNIEVFDLMGRSVLATSSEDDRVNININQFANGIYYLRIQSDKETKVVKVVKQ